MKSTTKPKETSKENLTTTTKSKVDSKKEGSLEKGSDNVIETKIKTNAIEHKNQDPEEGNDKNQKIKIAPKKKTTSKKAESILYNGGMFDAYKRKKH